MDVNERYIALWKPLITKIIVDAVKAGIKIEDVENIHFCDGTQVVIGDTTNRGETTVWTIAVGTGPAVLCVDVKHHISGPAVYDWYMHVGDEKDASVYRDACNVLVRWSEAVLRDMERA